MRLLLVEDNERFAQPLKRGLAAAGFVVDVLPTAEDAAAALRASRFAIVVLDLGLPDADGLDVLSQMRRRQDAASVLILTARGSLEDRVIGMQNGADDYLVKPFALEELVARLQALLRAIVASKWTGRRQDLARRRSLRAIPGSRVERGGGLCASTAQAARGSRRLGANPHIARCRLPDRGGEIRR